MTTVPMEPGFWINARYLTQPLSGVQRYAHNIAMRLPEGRLVTPAPPRPFYDGIPADRIQVHSRLAYPHLWDQVSLPRVVPSNSLLWSPASAGPISHRRHVQTIHDMALFDLPECFRGLYAAWYRHLLPVVARRARMILTDSQATRERIVDLLHVPDDRLSVVALAADERFCPQPGEQVQKALRANGIDAPYLLALGTISPRKNFQRLIDAWNRISSDYTDVQLLVVGEPGVFFSGGATMGALPRGVRHLTGVGDDLLVNLYAGAAGFVYPSLYEGFGLPILEAMAVGTPVITSDATSLPEVAGDAAIYVDPLDTESIADGMRRVLDDRALRDSLAQRGLERARLFSWDRTARETHEVLMRVATD